jgi:acetyl esterase/lipase
MIQRLFCATLFCTASLWSAAQPLTMPLWPGLVPGAASNPAPEQDITKPKDNLVAGKTVVRLGNVSVPSLTLHLPATNPSGASVVVFPGGGYNILARDLEGTEVCGWLNAINVACALVKYRVPASGPYPKYSAALQDGQRAVSLVRSHAAEWHLNAQHVGVLGFSAGGHLAAAVSTHFEHRVYDKVDAADEQSSRPDFTVLIYPAYLAVPGPPPSLKSEIPVNAQTPPAILVQAEDDPAAPVENSLMYYLALKQAKVPAEMHLYAKGGHGYGLRKSALPVTGWPKRVEEWLHTQVGIPPPEDRITSRAPRGASQL